MEGMRNPLVDDLLLERLRRTIVAVFETVATNAFRYDVHDVVALLAVWEERHPGASVAPV